ncbi:phosphate ABC transporter ATP-binding protein, partial [Paenibacillus riograndensis]
LMTISDRSVPGRQQQCHCIDRALGVQPDILLMDQATTAIDPVSTLKIEELVQELRYKYMFVMVTHNIHQDARVSGRTVIFLNGVIVEAADTAMLFSNPKDSRTEDYISGRFG